VSKYDFRAKQVFKRGDVVNPLGRFDFDDGSWDVYLVIGLNDFKDLHPSIKKATCLKTDDIELLRQMKERWFFVYSGGDMATVESSIFFLKMANWFLSRVL